MLRNLLAVLLLSPLLLKAQSRKLPEVDPDRNLKRPYNFDYSAALRQSYVELELSDFGRDGFDTSALRKRTFEGGRLIRSEEYSYADDQHRRTLRRDIPAPPSMLMSGTIRQLIYDAAGNRTRQVEFETLPSGSLGLAEQHLNVWARQQYAGGLSRELIDARAPTAIDSLRRNPPGTIITLKDSLAISYDGDGNPLTRFELRNPFHQAAYSYRIGSDQHTVVQRIERRSRHGGGMASVHLFEFDAQGRLLQVNMYRGPVDSVNIRSEPFLQRSETYVYNGAGLPETVVFRSRGRKVTTSTRYSESGKPQDILTTDSGMSSAYSDTISFARFRYDSLDRPLQFYERYYFTLKSVSQLRQDLRYDATGRLAEVRSYNWTGTEEPRLMWQRLLFYGDDSDVETAALSLRGKPAPVAIPSRTGKPQPAPTADTSKPAPGVYRFVERMPEFAGSMPAWLNKNQRYPTDAKAKRINGRVVVTFVVGADGKVRDAEVVRGLHPSCDAEALRLVSKMPRWIPGRQHGHPVDVYMTLPIVFRSE